MGRHALQGAVTAWLALIALSAIGSKGGSGRVASLFADVDGLVQRALSPNVPAIPDRRGAAAGGSSYLTPAQAAAAAKAAAGAPALHVFDPGGLLDGMPSLNQYVNGGGLPGLAGLGQSAPH